MSLLLLFNNQVAPDATAVMPTVQVLLETTPDVMVDISSDYEMWTTTRGRNRELDRFQAGTAMVQLLDTSRKYDPSNAAGPYYPNLKPMRQVQITATWNGTTYPQFTGYVDSFESQYAGPPNGNAVTTIYATDGFKVLEAADLASSAYAQEVLADTPLHWWRLDEPASASTLFDSGSSRANLTVTGTPTLGVDGLVSRDAGTALQFTGTPQGAYAAGTVPFPALTAFTVECLFSSASTDDGNLLAWTNDIVSAGFILDIAGFDDKFRAGVLTTAGLLNLTGTTTVDDGVARHVAITWDGATVNLLVNGVVEATGALGGTMAAANNSQLYLGAYQTSGGGSTSPSGTVDEVAVYSTALSPARIAAHVTQMSTPWNGDTPGARIGRVLDAAAWPATLRQLDTGTSTLQSAELDMTALEHAQKSAESDFGVLFMKADGRVRFIGRAGLFNLAELATFGDGGGGELGYVSLRPELTDQLIRNDVTVSHLEGVAQNVKDTSSIGTYLRHSYVADGLYHNSDTLSKSAAEFIVSEFKEPLRRISNLVVSPRGDPSNLFPKVLGLELEDQITVKDRPPGGGAANSQDTSIEGISHTVTPMGWETTWNLAPSFGASGTPGNVWALGITGFGELGQTTRLAF